VALALLVPGAAPGVASARPVTGATVTGPPAAAAVPAAAQADGLCRTVRFSPRSVVVGATPASATFHVTASGCTLRHWELSLGPYDYYTYLQSPKASVGPLRHTAAGPRDVIVDTCNSGFDCRSTLVHESFTLKRRTTWQVGSVIGTSGPVHRGHAMVLRGRLLVVNWDARRYVGYGGRTVVMELRTPTGSYAPVRTALTDNTGWVRTTVPAARAGVWRMRFAGNSEAGPATAVGHTVKVVR
jgi:hypothetical protein